MTAANTEATISAASAQSAAVRASFMARRLPHAPRERVAPLRALPGSPDQPDQHADRQPCVDRLEPPEIASARPWEIAREEPKERDRAARDDAQTRRHGAHSESRIVR